MFLRAVRLLIFVEKSKKTLGKLQKPLSLSLREDGLDEKKLEFLLHG